MTTAGLMWANLWRRKTRTIVTVLSIFVAFVLFAVLAATRQAFVGGVDLIGNERLLTIHKSGLICVKQIKAIELEFLKKI